MPARSGKVIIVTFGGGVRYSGDVRAGRTAQYPAAGGNAAERLLLSELHQLGRALAFQFHREYPYGQLAAC